MQWKLHLYLLFGMFVPSGTATTSSGCHSLYTHGFSSEAAPQFGFKWLILETNLDTLVCKLPALLKFVI